MPDTACRPTVHGRCNCKRSHWTILLNHARILIVNIFCEPSNFLANNPVITVLSVNVRYSSAFLKYLLRSHQSTLRPIIVVARDVVYTGFFLIKCESREIHILAIGRWPEPHQSCPTHFNVLS